MAMTMHVDVVSAEESCSRAWPSSWSSRRSRATSASTRATPADGRAPPGSVRIQQPGKDEEILIYVSGGLLEIQPHTVSVLSDTAIRSADLDEAQALAAKKQART